MEQMDKFISGRNTRHLLSGATKAPPAIKCKYTLTAKYFTLNSDIAPRPARGFTCTHINIFHSAFASSKETLEEKFWSILYFQSCLFSFNGTNLDF